MLSSTTMVLSMVMPMAKAMPASEMTLMVRPNSNSPRKPATVQIGMPSMPMTVAEPERRNRNITNTARPAPMARFL